MCSELAKFGLVIFDGGWIILNVLFDVDMAGLSLSRIRVADLNIVAC